MTFDLAVVLAGATLAALVSGSSGFAFALIASSIWLHVLPPRRSCHLQFPARCWLGLRLFHHVSKNGFQKLIPGLFFVSGVALLR